MDIVQTWLSEIVHELSVNLQGSGQGLLSFRHVLSVFMDDFIFYYPVFMAYLWMMGAIIFYLRFERSRAYQMGTVPSLVQYPPVSILIPCYNEAENIRETLAALLRQNYPNFEIIAINDGSKDNTLEVLQELATQHPQLRVVNLDTNQGKAMGLKTAALLANSEYLICIDGDALLASDAIASERAVR